MPADENRHARKLLLRRWELTRASLLESATIEEYLLRSGRLLELSEVLQACRHSGDGADPILADEWTTEARRIIRDARAALEERQLVMAR